MIEKAVFRFTDPNKANVFTDVLSKILRVDLEQEDSEEERRITVREINWQTLFKMGKIKNLLDTI